MTHEPTITVTLEAREWQTFASILSRSSDVAVSAGAAKLAAKAKAHRGSGRMEASKSVDGWAEVLAAACNLAREGPELSIYGEIQRQVIAGQKLLAEPDVRFSKANRLEMRRRRVELTQEFASGVYDECGPFGR